MPNKQSSLLSFFRDSSRVESKPRIVHVGSKNEASRKGPPKPSLIRSRDNKEQRVKQARLNNKERRRHVPSCVDIHGDENGITKSVVQKISSASYDERQTPPNNLANIDISSEQIILEDEKDQTSALGLEETQRCQRINEKNVTSNLLQTPSATRECGKMKNPINNVISDSESSPRDDCPGNNGSKQKDPSDENILATDDKTKLDDIEHAGADTGNNRELSDYEKLRLRNIKRNFERLAKLGLLAPEIHGEKQHPSTKRKGVKKRKKNLNTFTSTPLRRSTRRKGEALVESKQISNLSNEMEEKYQAKLTRDDEKETFEASPVTQYIMGMETPPRVSAPNSERQTKYDWNQLKPTGKLIQDRDIALYSLDMFGHSSNFPSQWVVGAGKSGIIALWNCASSTDTSLHNDDEILPMLTWKAHNGRWIADARFLPLNDFKSHPSRLLTAANDGRVCLWDLSSSSCSTGVPKCLSTTGKQLHSSGIFSMDVATGKGDNDIFVCTGSKDKTIALTSLESITRGGDCTPLFRSNFHSGKVGCVEVNKGMPNLIASASDDGFVALHDYNSNRVVAELEDAHQRPHSVTWHPKHHDIFMTAGNDDHIHVWDMRFLKNAMITFTGHVPLQTKRCKKIHRPVFFPTSDSHAVDNDLIMTGSEGSHCLSTFGFSRVKDSTQQKQTVNKVLSRGFMPDNCGDVGCIASCSSEIAVAVNGGDVLLLSPSQY